MNRIDPDLIVMLVCAVGIVFGLLDLLVWRP